MNRKYFRLALPALLAAMSLLTSCAPLSAVASDTHVDYDRAMVDLVADLHSYAREKNPSFEMVSNGGADLFLAENGNTEENAAKLAKNLDGALVEAVFYGWDMSDDQRTPSEESRHFAEALGSARDKGLPVFNIDYCHTPSKMRLSYEHNDRAGYVGFAAPRRELDSIPAGEPAHANAEAVGSMRQAQNFLPLLNPDRFHSKQEYLHELQQTNYDLLIIDMYFDGEPLANEDVAALKNKQNGAPRLVFAYLSVGEAEDYRDYWQASWKEHPPYWLEAPNPDWEGNYKVRYWTPEWRAILYGSSASYLDKVIAAGFDGAFLDVIDAYEYFQQGA